MPGQERRRKGRREARPTRGLRGWAGFATLPAALLVAAPGVPVVRAQAPGAVSGSAKPDSARAGMADSLRAMQDAVRRTPDDAARWHRLGQLAGAASVPARGQRFVKSQQMIDWLRLADSALYRATVLAPDSGRYDFDYAHQIVAVNRTQVARAIGFVERAVGLARAAGDSLLLAESLDELGTYHWRRYERVVNRRLLLGISTVTEGYLLDRAEDAPAFLTNLTARLTPPLGEGEYRAALDAFAEAALISRADPRARRHLFKALAEHHSWEELAGVTRAQAQRVPWDPWVWLASGLALHRVGQDRAAQAAFDTAFAAMDEAMRNRFTDLGRILRPPDSTAFGASSPDVRRATSALFWDGANPSALLPANAFRLEFLSRVVESDLRWTLDNEGTPGSDSDRGQLWVRYGPPDSDATFASAGVENSSSLDLPAAENWELWYYADYRTHFIFREPAMYETADLTLLYRSIQEEARAKAPAGWTNLPVARGSLGSMGFSLTRFRAPGDSVDLFVVATDPRGASAGPDVRGVRLAHGLSLYNSSGAEVLLDSLPERGAASAVGAAGLTVWRERVPAIGTTLARVDALEPTTLRNAKTLMETRLAADTGFGMSDVLVAHGVAPGMGGRGDRWTDFLITPGDGVFSRSQSVALLWETYGVPMTDGSRSYRVTVTVARRKKGGAAGMALRIARGAREALNLSVSGRDSVRVSYLRQVASPTAVADYLDLDLGHIPAGDYRVTVDVLDPTSGTAASRSRDIVVRE